MRGYKAALRKAKQSKRRAATRRLKGLSLAKLGQLNVSRRPSDKVLDELWAELVKTRDRLRHGPRCRMCCWREGTTAYHIVAKQLGHHIRWLPENGLLSCAPCNGGENWNRILYRVKHVKMFGADFIDGLEAKAVSGRGFPVDRFAVFAILKYELRKLKGEKGAEDREGLSEGGAVDGQERPHKPHDAGQLPGGPAPDAGAEPGPGGPAVRADDAGPGVGPVQRPPVAGSEGGAAGEPDESGGGR